MKKTILIGTILATTILILMSFTSPVSAQTNKKSVSLTLENILEKIDTPFKKGSWFPGFLFIKLYEFLKDNELFPLIQIITLLIGSFINITGYFIESGQWYPGFYIVLGMTITYYLIKFTLLCLPYHSILYPTFDWEPGYYLSNLFNFFIRFMIYLALGAPDL